MGVCSSERVFPPSDYLDSEQGCSYTVQAIWVGMGMIPSLYRSSGIVEYPQSDAILRPFPVLDVGVMDHDILNTRRGVP